MPELSKLKILRLLEIMRKTDEDHPLNATQIAAKLGEYGISAERKTISRDIACLEDAGYSIIKCQNHNLGWYMADQEFEDYELKLLADAVASAEFLSFDDTMRFVKKIKSLATYSGEQLISDTIIVDADTKIGDKTFKFKYDAVMRAISLKKQISFRYIERIEAGKKVFMREGHVYTVNPYFVVLYNGRYYLLVNPVSHKYITHFKLDMLSDIEILDTPARSIGETEEWKAEKGKFNVPDYIRRSVNMWSGDVVNVKLRCRKYIRQDIISRFGKNVMFIEKGGGDFEVNVSVADEIGFYSLIASFGDNAVIISPDFIREKYIEYINEILIRYKEDE